LETFGEDIFLGSSDDGAHFPQWSPTSQGWSLQAAPQSSYISGQTSNHRIIEWLGLEGTSKFI